VRELLFVLLLGSMGMEMGRPDDEEDEVRFHVTRKASRRRLILYRMILTWTSCVDD